MTSPFGRVSMMPIALFTFIADLAIQEMSADSRTVADPTALKAGVPYILKVLQDWNLISWNEAALKEREQWAGRLDD